MAYNKNQPSFQILICLIKIWTPKDPKKPMDVPSDAMMISEVEEIEIEESRAKTDFGKEFVSQTKFLKRRKEREEGGSKPFFANNITIVLLLAALIVAFYILFLR